MSPIRWLHCAPGGHGSAVENRVAFLNNWRERRQRRSTPIDRWRTRPRRRRFGPPLWLPVLLAAALVTLWSNGWSVLLRAENGAFVRVVDGDSLRIDGQDVRIAGYDAPEWGQFCSTDAGLPWPCGVMARRELARLVAAGGLVCAAHGRDQYGRMLAHCRAAGGDIGANMVREGLGLRTRYSPFRYGAEETEARTHGRGVWQGAHEHPEDYRRAN